MKIKLISLGIGKGASYVLKGIASTAFTLQVDEQPFMLIDSGAGVTLAYQNYIGLKFPPHIYISHNHMDHTGDLPILLSVFPQISGIKPNVIGNRDVLEIVKKHRLSELVADGTDLNSLAIWVRADSQGSVDLGKDLSLQLFKSKHSYDCYGFVLKRMEHPIFGYTADSGFDENIYRMVSQTGSAIVDGREKGNDEHASFDEISNFACKYPDCKYWVTHYEETEYIFSNPNVQFWKPGSILEFQY